MRVAFERLRDGETDRNACAVEVRAAVAPLRELSPAAADQEYHRRLLRALENYVRSVELLQAVSSEPDAEKAEAMSREMRRSAEEGGRRMAELTAATAARYYDIKGPSN